MWLDIGPEVTSLSSFQRFPKLQVLRLAIGSGDRLLDDEFVIDHTVPDLVFLALHDRLFLRACPPGSKLGELLPKIEHASFRIQADNAGVRLAEDAIKLGRLKKLCVPETWLV